MKSIGFICFLLISIKSSSQVALNLEQVNSGTSNAIVDMYFADSLKGFFLTEYGEIFSSLDGGNNWSMIYEDSTFVTDSEFSAQEMTSLVSTSDSVFVYSNFFSSGGLKCARLKSAVLDIGFTKDTLNDWVIFPECWGNEIWDRRRVSDSIIQHYPSSAEVFELQVSENRISGSTDTRMYLSNDNGLTWLEKEFTASSLNSSPYQSFHEGDTMYAITNYPTTIHKSFDGGLSWSANSLPTAYFKLFKDYLLGYSLFSGSQIYAVDMDGNITFESSVPKQILNLYLITESEGFVTGKEGMLLRISVDIDSNTEDLNTSGQSIKLNIFPNPTSSFLEVKVLENVKVEGIELCDIDGRRVKIFSKNESTLDLEDVVAGIYFLKVSTSEGILVEKVLVD
jgi:hypothetical protein